MHRTTIHTSLLVVILTMLALILSGCVTTQTRGDRAYENGNYNEALDYYEELFDEGVKDPEIYHRAAKASIAIGGFVAAERYYTLALRHGAGLDVARELGEFYVNTSNYASAVRIFQFLLRAEKKGSQTQAIYNNLGAALMYAGSPFDAESYLMIAQQMQPRDPFPYLNLGLLYDRHLKQPWLAINFYECFVGLAPESGRSPEVRQRTQELSSRWTRLYEPGVVSCGEAYVPKSTGDRANLREILGPPAEGEDETIPTQTIEVGDPEGEVNDVQVERMVEDTPSTDSASKPDPIQRAKIAHAEARHKEAVELLTGVPLASLKARDKAILGASLMEISRPADAILWLEMSLNERETPETVELLLRAYRRGDQKERMVELCSKYEERRGFGRATESCPERDSGSDTKAGKDG